MQDGAADDGIHAVGVPGERGELTVPDVSRRREAANGSDRRRIGIDRTDVEALRHEVHEVAPRPAPSVQYPTPIIKPPAQQLIEQVDINRTKLPLEFFRNLPHLPYVSTGTFARSHVGTSAHLHVARRTPVSPKRESAKADEHV